MRNFVFTVIDSDTFQLLINMAIIPERLNFFNGIGVFDEDEDT